MEIILESINYSKEELIELKTIQNNKLSKKERNKYYNKYGKDLILNIICQNSIMFITEQNSKFFLKEIKIPEIIITNKPKNLEFKKYQKKVHKLSKLKDLHTLFNFDKPKVNHKTFNSENHYVIDHKISIHYCFNNNIPEEIAADISNLRWITGKENSSKSIKNYVDENNEWILNYNK